MPVFDKYCLPLISPMTPLFFPLLILSLGISPLHLISSNSKPEGQSNQKSPLWQESERSFKNGELEKARQQLRQLVILDPNLTEAYERLAHIAIKEGEYPAALEYIEKALALKESAPLFYLKGLTYLKDQELEQAQNSFERGLSRFPKDSRLASALDKTRTLQIKKNQRPNQPPLLSDSLWEKGKNSVGIQFIKAQFYLGNGKLKWAKELLEKVHYSNLCGASLKKEALFHLFLCELYDENFYKAKNTLEELKGNIPSEMKEIFLSLEPLFDPTQSGNEPLKFRLLGRIAENSGHFGFALKFYNRAQNLDPENIELLVRMSRIFMQLRQYKRGEKVLKAIARRSKGSFESGINLLKFHLSGAGNLKEALTLFEALQKKDPHHEEIRYFSSFIDLIQGRPEQAREKLLTLARDKSLTPGIQKLSVVTLKKIENLAGKDNLWVRRELLRIINLPSPIEVEDHLAKGENFLRQNHFFLALLTFEKLKGDYQMSQVLFNLSNRLEDLEDPQGADLVEKFAFSKLMEAVKQNPGRVEYRLQLANYYKFKGFKEQAREECTFLLNSKDLDDHQKEAAGIIMASLDK